VLVRRVRRDQNRRTHPLRVVQASENDSPASPVGVDLTDYSGELRVPLPSLVRSDSDPVLNLDAELDTLLVEFATGVVGGEVAGERNTVVLSGHLDFELRSGVAFNQLNFLRSGRGQCLVTARPSHEAGHVSQRVVVQPVVVPVDQEPVCKLPVPTFNSLSSFRRVSQHRSDLQYLQIHRMKRVAGGNGIHCLDGDPVRAPSESWLSRLRVVLSLRSLRLDGAIVCSTASVLDPEVDFLRLRDVSCVGDLDSRPGTGSELVVTGVVTGAQPLAVHVLLAVPDHGDGFIGSDIDREGDVLSIKDRGPT